METIINEARDRNIEKTYNLTQFVEKLRLIADCPENGEHFDIQSVSERVYVPKDAVFNIEHEHGDDEKEIEFQIKGNKLCTHDITYRQVT